MIRDDYAQYAGSRKTEPTGDILREKAAAAEPGSPCPERAERPPFRAFRFMQGSAPRFTMERKYFQHILTLNYM